MRFISKRELIIGNALKAVAILMISAITLGGAATFYTATDVTVTESATATAKAVASSTQSMEERFAANAESEGNVEQSATYEGVSATKADTVKGNGTYEAKATATSKKTCHAIMTKTANATQKKRVYWFNKDVISKQLHSSCRKAAFKRAAHQAKLAATSMAKMSAVMEAQDDASKKAKELAMKLANDKANELAIADKNQKIDAKKNELIELAKQDAQAQYENQQRAKDAEVKSRATAVAQADTQAPQPVAPADVAKLSFTTCANGIVPSSGYGMYRNQYVVAHNPGSGNNFMSLHAGDLVRVNGILLKVVDRFLVYGSDNYARSNEDIAYKDCNTGENRYDRVWDGTWTFQTCNYGDKLSVWIWKLMPA
jgi:hypothetical protein